jgi:hypothetical protein
VIDLASWCIDYTIRRIRDSSSSTRSTSTRALSLALNVKTIILISPPPPQPLAQLPPNHLIQTLYLTPKFNGKNHPISFPSYQKLPLPILKHQSQQHLVHLHDPLAPKLYLIYSPILPIHNPPIHLTPPQELVKPLSKPHHETPIDLYLPPYR